MFFFHFHHRYNDIFEKQTMLVHIDHEDSKDNQIKKKKIFFFLLVLLFHDEVEPTRNNHYLQLV